eukprot:scaffold3291_cov94-Skeletonema_dohrnii-CCMP3373.AAC.4
MTSSVDKDDAMKASLHNLQADRIPLIQRLNQQFVIESKFDAYANDIQTLGRKNRALIDSIDGQQSRLRTMQSMLHQTADNQDITSRRSPENTPAPIQEQDDSAASGNTNDSYSLQNNNVDTRCRNDANLSLNTQQDISIHRREQRNELNKFQSASSEDKADYRRSQFLHRIASIEQTIEELKATKDKLPVQQAYLTRKMQRQQQRILSLRSEIERVSPLEDSAFVSSDLLHACTQTFTKKHFVRRLQLEMTSCRENIAACREEIISMNRKLDSIAADIVKKRAQLGDRKAALLQYDKQRNIVSKMRIVVSREPEELKKHFLLLWKKEVGEHKRIRSTLESIAASIRRRQYKIAWKHWTRLDSKSFNHSNVKGQGGGIGTDDLLLQEARLKENIDESSAILRKLLKTDERDGDEQATGTCTTNNLLGDEGEAILLKGDFLFSAAHYEASLKCFERAEAVISSHRLSGTAAIELAATVVNKIGRIHLAMQAIDLAIVYFGRNLSLAHEENNLETHQVSALIGLSECYMQKQDFRYACDFLLQSLPLICNEDRERTVYSLLQQCYEHMNKPEEAAFYSSKLHDMRDTRKERVEAAFNKIDSLRQRLIDVSASNSRVVNIQASSTKRVTLAKQMKAKEKELSDSNRALGDSREFSSQLEDLENEIIAEMEAAANAKKNRIISFRIHDSSQEIKKKELLFRLGEKLNMTRKKQEECLYEIATLERTARNLHDDLSDLQEEKAVEERPLVERVLELRSYRCVAINASNTALGNIAGDNGGVEYVALSNGKECFIHNMHSGELETVFMGDVEGQHVGPLVGHTSTITALFFHGTRVYTGSTDASIICWGIKSTEKLFQSKGHEGAITCIFSDGTKTLSGASDKAIIVWSLDGLLLHRITGHVGGVHRIQCGVSWFASSSYGTIFVWEMIRRNATDEIVRIKCRQRLTLSQGNVTALQFSESELVTGDNMGYLKVWNIKSGEAITSVKAHQSAVTSLQVDATKAVSCGMDMIVQVTDIIQGHVLQTLRGHNAPIFAVAFDQRQIVSVSSDGEIRFWSWGR